MEPFVPYKYSKFLFLSSFSMLIASLISYIMNDSYITLYFFILFITSINHWRRPEYGIRRNIDLFIVMMGFFMLLWQLCLLKSEFNRYCLCCMLICCIIFYIIEHIMEYCNCMNWVILHMTIHIYASCSIFLIIFD